MTRPRCSSRLTRRTRALPNCSACSPPTSILARNRADVFQSGRPHRETGTVPTFHRSEPIDGHHGRVLVMDVDRRFYRALWSPMRKGAGEHAQTCPGDFGPLAGETGGIIGSGQNDIEIETEEAGQFEGPSAFRSGIHLAISACKNSRAPPGVASPPRHGLLPDRHGSALEIRIVQRGRAARH